MALFYIAALLTPLAVLAAAEGILRVTWRSAALPLFVPMTLEHGDALVANRVVSRRWFGAEGESAGSDSGTVRSRETCPRVPCLRARRVDDRRLSVSAQRHVLRA